MAKPNVRPPNPNGYWKRRAICAAWGAVTAFAVGSTLFLLILGGSDWSIVAPCLALTGLVTGWFIQPHFVGPESGKAMAAVGGGLSALLGFPIFAVFGVLSFRLLQRLRQGLDPQLADLITIDSVWSLGVVWYWMVVWLGWIVIPVGALAGASLQVLFWQKRRT